MATVLQRHTTHTADHRNLKKDLFGDAPPFPIQDYFRIDPACGKDVFCENGLVQHVAGRFPGSCLCPLRNNSIKNSGDTARYRLGPPRQTRFNRPVRLLRAFLEGEGRRREREGASPGKPQRMAHVCTTIFEEPCPVMHWTTHGGVCLWLGAGCRRWETLHMAVFFGT